MPSRACAMIVCTLPLLPAGCYGPSRTFKHRLADTPPESRVEFAAIELQSPNSWDREDACNTLADLGDLGAVPLLIRALRDPQGSVRFGAVKALGVLRDRRAVPALLEMLNDLQMQEAAAGALGRIGDPRAVGPLIKVAENHAQKYPIQIARALGDLGDSRAVSVVLRLLQHPDARVRENAAMALGQLGDRAAIGPLTNALDDKDYEPGGMNPPHFYVSLAALQSLAELGEEGRVMSALTHVKPYVREHAIEILAHRHVVAAVNPIIDRLHDDDEIVREVSARALGQLSDPRARSALLLARRDPSPIVAQAAASALGQLAGAESSPNE